jgi:dolichyl-phosphate-mannose-protein mannosyltransferase
MPSLPTGANRARNAVCIWILAAALAAGAMPLRSLEARGPALVLVHCSDLIGALALLTLCAALGNTALDRLRIAFAWPEHLAFATAIGSGILASELLVVTALVGTRAWVIGLLLLANAILVGPAIAGFVDAVRLGSSNGVPAAERVSRTAKLALVGATVVMIVLAAPPPADWDSLMYHLLVPARWLQDGSVSTLSGNEHVGLVGLTHMLYVPLLATASTSGPGMVSALFAILVGVATYGLARRLFNEGAATYATVLLWGTPTIILVGATARVDVTLALFLLLAHFAVLVAWLDNSPGSLDLAALLTGMAVGVKYQAGAYAIALVPLLVLVNPGGGGARNRLAATMRFGLLSVLAAAPWLLKNQMLFGAPFYPLFVAHRVEPWLLPLLPAGTNSLNVDPRVWHIQESARTAFNIRDAFLNPGALGVGGETSFYFLNPLLALLPFGILSLRNIRLMALTAPALVYVVIILAVLPETNLRYLIPGIVALTITCSALAFDATERLPTAARRAIRILLALVCFIPTAGTVYIWVRGNHVLSNLVGLRSGAQYLATHASPVVRSQIGLIKAANPMLASGDTILMIYESRGLYLNAPALEDTRLVNWPTLRAALGPRRCLDQTGITHVLARLGAARYYEARGVTADIIGRRTFEEFSERCLKQLWTDGDVTLYSTHPSVSP